MRFRKLHGLGNDFVVIDAVREPALLDTDWNGLAPRLCDRHVGIGADGVIVLCPPRDRAAHVRMRIFNADGSEAAMCGNGTRCVAKVAREHLGLLGEPLLIEAGVDRSRVLSVWPVDEDGRVVAARVDMGPAEVGAPARVEVAGTPIDYTPVDVGNPHAVIVQRADGVGAPAFDLQRLGPLIERHPAFPDRTNVQVMVVETRDRARLRTWERGAGLTAACGSGACAAVAAARRAGLVDSRVRVTLPGGDLDIEIDARGRALMTGPCEEVFQGVWTPG